VFILMLLALGALIGWAGWDAIHKQHYEMEWKASTIGRASHGTLVFDGPEAIRIGTGLIAFGVMLTTWAVATALSIALRAKQKGSTPCSLGIGWLSLACLVLAFTCFFPPWCLASGPFYAVVTLVLWFIFALPDATRQTWSRKFFPAVICASILAAMINTAAGLGMVLGLFASLAVLGHMLLLFPRLQDKRLPPTDEG
jgi:lysylphosphatidylglycerol synthetase-like protein (DUF2156 family)